MKKVAICLRGAISRKNMNLADINSLEKSKDYINYVSVKKSIFKHIINANPSYSFDFFIYSWDEELEKPLNELYKPVRSVYINNSLFKDSILQKLADVKEFSQGSQFLSIQNVLLLKEHYELENNFHYDIVIVYRPDVLLWKDMILDKYNLESYIYVNGHPDCEGDFHFVMNNKKAREFKFLFYYLNNTYTPLQHKYIKWYVYTILQENYCMDSIIPGVDQEIVRKITFNLDDYLLR
jgi:hypothetical protein